MKKYYLKHKGLYVWTTGSESDMYINKRKLAATFTKDEANERILKSYITSFRLTKEEVVPEPKKKKSSKEMAKEISGIMDSAISDLTKLLKRPEPIEQPDFKVVHSTLTMDKFKAKYPLEWNELFAGSGKAKCDTSTWLEKQEQEHKIDFAADLKASIKMLNNLPSAFNAKASSPLSSMKYHPKENQEPYNFFISPEQKRTSLEIDIMFTELKIKELGKYTAEAKVELKKQQVILKKAKSDLKKIKQ